MIRFLSDMFRVLSLPCREHAALASRSLDTPLRPGESFGLRTHTLYCSACRRFRNQLLRLRSMSADLRRDLDAAPGMPDAVRTRLSDRLGTKSGNS